jgi:hypothetical protein
MASLSSNFNNHNNNAQEVAATFYKPCISESERKACASLVCLKMHGTVKAAFTLFSRQQTIAADFSVRNSYLSLRHDAHCILLAAAILVIFC